MPMKPEEKAKQKARIEAGWAKDRGETTPPPISNDFVAPGCKKFSEPVTTGAEPPADLGPYPEPEMPIDAHSSGAKFDTPEPFPALLPKPKKPKAAPIPKIPKSPSRAKNPKAK